METESRIERRVRCGQGKDIVSIFKGLGDDDDGGDVSRLSTGDNSREIGVKERGSEMSVSVEHDGRMSRI